MTTEKMITQNNKYATEVITITDVLLSSLCHRRGTNCLRLIWTVGAIYPYTSFHLQVRDLHENNQSIVLIKRYTLCRYDINFSTDWQVHVSQ